MKSISIFLAALFGAAVVSSGQTLRNCSQILAENPTAASGVFSIDPDGAGELPSMNCFCDMTSDGGGWTLILNYNHLTATNSPLEIRTGSFPLLGSSSLGVDESGTAYWGHIDTALTNAIPFDEVRFYGITSDHNRIIHFKSTHPGTISYFKTGFGSTAGISADFTAFGDHSAFLPAAINMSESDKGNYAMTDYPLWTGSLYHWYLGGVDAVCSAVRWEVDNYPCFSEPSTLHQIWVRQNNIPSGLKDPTSSDLELMLSPNPAGQFVNISLLNGVEANATLMVYNNIGELVYSGLLSQQTSQMDLTRFESGIYTFFVKTRDGVCAQRLVIEK